ncbi:MAG: tetratricopeptide repeat protein, partial [Cyclobacteriaceae bacterium]
MNYQGSPDQRMSSGLFGKTMSTLAIALLFLANSTFAQSPEIRKAFRLIDIEQPSKGMAALEQAAKAPENLYYLGLGYIQTGDLEKAMTTFEKGASANDKDPLNIAGKGHVKLLQKKSAEGKALLVQAADMNRKKSAEQLKAVGRGYMADTKFLLDAISTLEKAKGINNGDAEIHQLLGDSYLLQNRGGESVSSYERAAAAEKKWAKPLYSIAKVYQRSRNNDIVLENLNRAISVDPEYAPAYKELGETFYKKKEAGLAVKAIERYLSISENPGQAKFQYAFFLFMAKDYQKANEIFKEVLNDKNASPTALKFYAFSLIEQDKDQEAREILEQFFQKAKPEDLKASDYASYGKLLLKLSEDSLANETFAKGILLDSADIDVLELQAETYLKRRKYQEAAQSYKGLIAVRETPKLQDLFNMGQAYYYNAQYIEADSAFTELAVRQPKTIYGPLMAAKSRAQYDSTGEKGVAIPMYESFVALALENPEKNKKELIAAYDYLGQYALHKKDNVLEAKGFFQKILQLDPKNERALEFM